MNFMRQTGILFLTHLRVWWRTPRQAVISLVLSCAFLLVGTQLLNVHVRSGTRVGLCAGDLPVGRTIENELAVAGVSTVRYADGGEGETALIEGRIVALVGVTPISLALMLPGRNPLIDREVERILLGVATRVTHRMPRAGRIIMLAPRRPPADVTAFMTASLIPFLIMTLATINCGMHWLRDWESGTIHALKALPFHRPALLVARTLGGGVLALVILAAALAVCRAIIPWPLPERLAPWFAVIAVQTLFSLGFFTAIAAFTRKYLLYVDASMLLVVLMMFSSATIKPIEAMAGWERVVAHLTPAFYAVRAMRAAMLGSSPVLAGDMAVLLGCSIVCFAAGHLIFTRSAITR
ncbi:ABC transporter permease [bacterium]|nr:ABC transporter permease [bacterium]